MSAEKLPHSISPSRTALVVGGASGMGAAIVVRLLADGFRVAVGDIDIEGARLVAAHGGDDAYAIEVDAVSQESVLAAHLSVSNWSAPPTVLVYTAGALQRTRFEDISLDEWRQSIAINLDGAFLCSQAVLAGMISAGWGRIVLFSSTAGKTVSTLGGVHYTTAKTAVLGLTRGIAAEVADRGVTVNAICPGLIETGMIESVATRRELLDYANSFPIPRLGTPSEVAALVSYLCSTESAYITGASLDINGGDLMI